MGAFFPPYISIFSPLLSFLLIVLGTHPPFDANGLKHLKIFL